MERSVLGRELRNTGLINPWSTVQEEEEVIVSEICVTDM
jgi:hypothetical protein